MSANLARFCSILALVDPDAGETEFGPFGPCPAKVGLESNRFGRVGPAFARFGASFEANVMRNHNPLKSLEKPRMPPQVALSLTTPPRDSWLQHVDNFNIGPRRGGRNLWRIVFGGISVARRHAPHPLDTHTHHLGPFLAVELKHGRLRPPNVAEPSSDLAKLGAVSSKPAHSRGRAKPGLVEPNSNLGSTSTQCRLKAAYILPTPANSWATPGCHRTTLDPVSLPPQLCPNSVHFLVVEMGSVFPLPGERGHNKNS